MFDYFAQAGQRANEGSIRLEACEVIIAIDLENPRESLLLPLPLLLAPAAAPGRCPWPLGGARGGGRCADLVSELAAVNGTVGAEAARWRLVPEAARLAS